MKNNYVYNKEMDFITKNGHTMFLVDVVKDIHNLQDKLDKLEQEDIKWKGEVLLYYGEPEEKIKEGLFDIITRYKMDRSKGGYSANELVDFASVMFFSFARKCLIEIELQQKLEELEEEIRKKAKQEVFDIFDQYSCIKNDKWYLELKQKEIGGNK